MRITERRLRSIIRSVIKESNVSEEELLMSYKEQIANCYRGDKEKILDNINMIRKNFSGEFARLKIDALKIMRAESEAFRECM